MLLGNLNYRFTELKNIKNLGSEEVGKYIAYRIFWALVTILLITFITFMLMNAIPGGPFLSEKAPSPAVLDALNAKYGLDKPLLIQFKNYIVNAFQGDLGVSFKMQLSKPVLTIILQQFPTSAKLGGSALLFAIIAGIPLGSVAAFHRGKFLDGFIRVVTTVGIAVPSFVLATTVMIIFGVKLGWLPTMGLSSPLHYILPVFALGFYPACYIARLTRSSMLDVLNQDYIRTAKAKGVTPFVITFKHALRNSLIPVVTYIGPLTAFILTGSLVVESVFSIPGLGRYFIQSISNRDYPLVMGTTIFLAFLIVGLNLVVDIVYKVIDPRIQLSMEA